MVGIKDLLSHTSVIISLIRSLPFGTGAVIEIRDHYLEVFSPLGVLHHHVFIDLCVRIFGPPPTPTPLTLFRCLLLLPLFKKLVVLPDPGSTSPRFD
jgi:hypothetical protein